MSTSIPSALSIAPSGPGWPFPGLGSCASDELVPDGRKVGVGGSDSPSGCSFTRPVVEGFDRDIPNSPRRPEVVDGEARLE